MAEWNPEDERQFAECCRRAAQQSREYRRRASQQEEASPPPPQEGPPTAEPAPSPCRRGAFSAADRETLLILALLLFLLRQRADRELLWALLYILIT